ncbi:MazG-like family protein [Proteiniborus sp. MB09-C3]|uniref:MazG-like family protein n=1 Tax=Proteiniborus sp. MB09-C3 TaxID=3050072 RepID=UPI00255590C7|nr:MazG-like family protein [Proteiniborus sp. MB09-C3]WIV12521.1 MazG-like family protein [Proteiniborus sp. MB09-C3]
MSFNDKNIDVTKNIKVIEWLKSELLMAVASLYELLVKGIQNSHDAMLDSVSNIILVAYLLGKRLGVSYESIDAKVEEKAKLALVEEHKIEQWYGDLGSLLEYFKRKRS